MKAEKVEAIERFVEEMDEAMNSFISNTHYLRSDLKGEERDIVIKIITDKLEGLKASRNKKEVKQFIDIDSVVEKYGDFDE